MGLEERRFAQIAQSANEVEAAISHGDDGVFTEHKSLSSFSRNGEFGKNDASHTCLNNHSEDTLRRHHNYGKGAFLSCGSEKIKRFFVDVFNCV